MQTRASETALRAFRVCPASIVIAIGLSAVALTATAAVAAPATVSVHSAQISGLGKILVNASGRTLYHASAEPKNVTKCTGACAADWPPLLVAAGTKPVAGPGVRMSLLGTVKRSDGKLQVTYAGMPLYLYSGDKKAGSVKGQGVGAVSWLGGMWNAVATSGAVVKTVIASPGSGSSGKPKSDSASEPTMTCY
jgi:predicted lipoprotein with Yx(FWY)xxD motif